MNLDNIILIEDHNKHLLCGGLPYEKISKLVEFLLNNYIVIYNPNISHSHIYVPIQHICNDTIKNRINKNSSIVLVSEITIDGQNWKLHNYHRVYGNSEINDILVKLRTNKFNLLLDVV